MASLTNDVNAYLNENEICICEDSNDCTDALKDEYCSIVNLADNIEHGMGWFLYDLGDISNKVFDCKGNTISDSSGLYFNSSHNNTIQNSNITINL